VAYFITLPKLTWDNKRPQEISISQARIHTRILTNMVQALIVDQYLSCGSKHRYKNNFLG
jgi:hypothetical protein